MKQEKLHFVVCVKNRNYLVSLERYKIYRVLPDAVAERKKYIRIVDESGEDYLYPQSYFVSINLPKTLEKALSLPA